MFKYVIEGGNQLSGNVRIFGSKNTSLTVLPAAILTDEVLEFTNLPHVQDVVSMLAMFADVGATISLKNSTEDASLALSLSFKGDIKNIAAYEFVSKMRASILLLGPMLSRFGYTEISLPGGCTIGSRPVDLHIMAMEKFGAEITLENGYIKARAPKGGLVGGRIEFPKITVGGTENALMAAVLAKGETIIENAAIEPEILYLCDILIKMGAKIDGVGTHTLKITGVAKLHGAKYCVPSDRIQTFTYSIISAATGFNVDIVGASMGDFLGTIKPLSDMGIEVFEKDGVIKTVKKGEKLTPVNVKTDVIPGFPTDCQAQLMALCAVTEGKSIISEDIFENRMMHVPELNRMGADIKIDGNTAYVNGVKSLFGTKVMATDLRASACLVIAGLVAKGTTEISRVYHIDRGYDFLPAKLEACGAKIRKITE
ncbi:UDP-N-acetylglucosamine 1-carboxyvinyltransferase [Candidatus Deianiraea vastatrix]|uniref:UDP-N-acetylglucosamine 1-carboxyvinyltransferase n=1 Tax=Candidatus Deianiraea vastatrix TaxID=2163644 RepID=A0A5B8XEF3_9RICK|nr:UDP-N-acetylglucosamine 1-carboxyvinyltransferase [Candidatus Deianiraea vastatrix]QED23356.1 UDP-N-acetylglucosamine 1-carboxyvinyltransferase [Candidatus Deianiraea vastatrix]